VCVAAEPGHAVRVYVQDLDGGPPRPVTPEGVGIPLGFHPLSPDGRFIAVIGPDKKARLYPVAGGGEPQAVPGLEPGEVPTRFSADGRALYAFRRGDMPARVFRVDIATGRRQIFRVLSPGDPAGVSLIARVQLTPDGKTYAYNARRLLSELYVAEGLK
jgi:eukaryotic-like serine/threonine-protein kinase